MSDDEIPREVGEAVYPTAYTEMEVVGGRVGLLSCAVCGASILIGTGKSHELRHVHYHIERGDL